MKSVPQTSRVTSWERFSIDCEGLSCNQFVSLRQLKTKSNLRFSFYQLDPVSLFPLLLGCILLRMTLTAFLPRPAPVAKCVLLI